MTTDDTTTMMEALNDMYENLARLAVSENAWVTIRTVEAQEMVLKARNAIWSIALELEESAAVR